MPRFVVVMTSHERTRFSYYATCSHLEHFKSSRAGSHNVEASKILRRLDTKYNLMSSHIDTLLVSFVLLVPSSNYAAIGEHAG